MKDKIIKYLLYILLAIGALISLKYIFYTSTAMLTSDSVITDVLAHQQRITHQFILKDWYYGNEFWFMSLSIPTYILSYIIKDNLLLRQVSVLITAIIFFALLYIYGKKFLNKKSRLILITIFATGVSYSILDYFYAFNAYLTVVINSLILLILYYKWFEDEEHNYIYMISSFIFTFLFSMGSLRYIPTVTIPFILTEVIYLFKKYYNSNNIILKVIKSDTYKKILKLVIVSLLALLVYGIIALVYHFEARASNGTISTSITSKYLFENMYRLCECVFNFFGFDNKNHPYTFMIGKFYFLKQHKNIELFSLLSLLNIIKIIMCIYFMIVVPIILFVKYKNNDKKINFLFTFNMLSWIVLIYIYLVSSSFFHHYSELKYFIFNIVINIILGLYCASKYVCKNKFLNNIFNILTILYIVSNLYTNYIVIYEHDSSIVNKRLDIAKVLEENNLKFGYGEFWEGLMINFMSDYKIDVASINYAEQITPYRWYSKVSLYKKNYHKGKVFFIFNERNSVKSSFYQNVLGKEDKRIINGDYLILIYNKNPLVKGFEEEKHEKKFINNRTLSE